MSQLHVLSAGKLRAAGLADERAIGELCKDARSRRGVRMPCCHCNCNEYVEVSAKGWSYTSYTRLIHRLDHMAAAVGLTYVCLNPACPAVKEKLDVDGIVAPAGVAVSSSSGVSFNSWDSKVVRNLPAAVLASLPVTFFRQGAIGSDLLAHLTSSTDSLADLERQLTALYAAKEFAKMSAYYRFVERERACAAVQGAHIASQFAAFGASALPPPQFLAWSWSSKGSLIGPPTQKIIKSALLWLHDDIAPLLYEDVRCRVPGRMISIDHTFFAILKTVEGGAFVLVMGEEHDICSYAHVKSTSLADLLPLLQALAARLARLRVCLPAVGLPGAVSYCPPTVVSALQALIAIYTDTCCNHGSDTSAGVYGTFFPCVLRCPFADGFHGVQKVPFNQAHRFAQGLKQQLGAILRQPVDEDIQLVIAYLMDPLRRKRDNLEVYKSEAAARAEALSNHRQSIRTVSASFRPHFDKSSPSPATLHPITTCQTPSCALQVGRTPAELTSELENLIRNVKSMPEVQVPTTTSGAGTLTTLENLVKCCGKGCYSDPLPVDQMYTRIAIGPQTGLPVYRKKGETSKNESAHRPLNAIFNEVSSLGLPLCKARLDFYVARHNADADARNGRSDAHSSLPWYHETHANVLASSAGLPLPYPRRDERRRQLNSSLSGCPPELFGVSYYEHHFKKLPFAELLPNPAPLSALLGLETSRVDACLRPPGGAPSAAVGFQVSFLLLI